MYLNPSAYSLSSVKFLYPAYFPLFNLETIRWWANLDVLIPRGEVSTLGIEIPLISLYGREIPLSN